MRRAGLLSSPSILLLLVSSNPVLGQRVVTVSRTPVTIELLRGEKGSAPRSITNACRAPHTFELTEAPEMEWFGIAGASRRLVAAGDTWNFSFEFDSTGMGNGAYEGEASLTCLDCDEERGCGPERFLYPVRMIVRRPDPDPELEDAAPEDFVAGQVLVALNVKSRGPRRPPPAPSDSHTACNACASLNCVLSRASSFTSPSSTRRLRWPRSCGDSNLSRPSISPSASTGTADSPPRSTTTAASSTAPGRSGPTSPDVTRTAAASG